MATEEELRVLLRVVADTAGAATVQNALRGVTGEAQRTSRAAGGISGAFRDASRSFAAGFGFGGGAALGAAAALALKDAFGAVIDEGIVFSRNMAEVKAISGATAAQMQQLGDFAAKAGVQFGVGAKEASAGLAELIRGGITVQDALGGAATAAITLAKAGGVTLAESAEIGSTALNAFGLQARDLSHVADLVAGAANASAIGVNDVRLSLAQVGSIARTAGVSIDDTVTSIALLGANGVKASDAGTSLKTFLTSLAAPSATATVRLRELGIIAADGSSKFVDASGKMRGMADIAQVLSDATRNLSEQQKLATLATIFGTDAVRAASILALEGATGFNDLATSMGKVSAQDVALKRLDSLAGDTEKFGGAMERLGVAIVTNLNPGLREAVQLATQLANFAAGKSEEGNSATEQRAAIDKALAARGFKTIIPNRVVQDLATGKVLTADQSAAIIADAQKAAQLEKEANALRIEADAQAAAAAATLANHPTASDPEANRQLALAKQLQAQATLQVASATARQADAEDRLKAAQRDVSEVTLRTQLAQLPNEQKIAALRVDSLQAEYDLTLKTRDVQQRKDAVEAENLARVASLKQQEQALDSQALGIKQQQLSLDQQALPIQNELAFVQRQITLSQRENFDLTRRILQLQQAARPAQEGLEDLDFRKRQLELEEEIEKQRRKNVGTNARGTAPAFNLASPRGAQDALTRIKNELKAIDQQHAQTELNALNAGHDLTVAQREQQAQATQQALDVLPLKERQQQLEDFLDPINQQKAALDAMLGPINQQKTALDALIQGETTLKQTRLDALDAELKPLQARKQELQNQLDLLTLQNAQIDAANAAEAGAAKERLLQAQLLSVEVERQAAAAKTFADDVERAMTAIQQGTDTNGANARIANGLGAGGLGPTRTAPNVSVSAPTTIEINGAGLSKDEVQQAVSGAMDDHDRRLLAALRKGNQDGGAAAPSSQPGAG